MQKKLRAGMVVSSLMLAMLVSGIGSVASAKSTKSTTKTKTTHTVKVKKTKTPKGHKRTLPGKVVSVSGSTIVMTKGNKTYTIDATGVTPVDRKGAAISFSDIKAGHKISVRGMVTGTTVSNILKLRDITLPVDTATTTSTTK